MGNVIGEASDFFRLRVVRVDESDELDLEWRDDVLYRRPVPESVNEADLFQVQAILMDNEEDITVLRSFASESDAYSWLDAVSEDMADMTRSAFESAYFPPE